MGNNNDPILVTGAHRSGTTWVGKMLAADRRSAYISEPLNVWHRTGVFRPRVKHWYMYITPQNESLYLAGFRELLSFRYHLLPEIASIRSQRDLLRMGRDWAIFLNGRLRRLRPVIKDPFAVFSSAWFAQRLKSRVVITVRHPAAFASSLKRLSWPFDFRDLLEQSALMRDHLGGDREEMESIRKDDTIGQSAVLWRLIYRFVHSIRNQNQTPIIVRHEDLSRDPEAGFRDLYGSLGLVFDERVRSAILHSSSAENPVELSVKKVHSVKLDSRANIDNWRKRLSPEEIQRVRQLTEGVSQLYYSDKEWGDT